MHKEPIPPKPDPDVVARFLDESEAELKKYVNETHHTYLDIYLDRMHALHASGADPEDVLRELWMAARTYADNADFYLSRWEYHKIRSRRLLPLELGLICGDPEVYELLAKKMGLDVMVLLAQTESRDITEELKVLTGWFEHQRVSDVGDFAGVLAALYCTALSALLTESSEGLRTSVSTAAHVIENAWVMTRHPPLGLARLLAAHGALGALPRPRDEVGFLNNLSDHGVAHVKGLIAAAKDDEAIRTRGANSLDLTALTLISAADALGLDVRLALDKTKDHLFGLGIPRRYLDALLGD